MSNSVKIYDGVSMLDGEMIQAYYTHKSKNTKTGNIPQVMFIAKNILPTDALKNGADKSVCGKCPLRPINGNPKKDSCYVNCGYGANAIFNANRRGNIPINESMYELTNDKIDVQRVGSYGDASCIPKSVSDKILTLAKKTLSYTHQWKDKTKDYLKSFCMASVHNIKDAIQAQKQGFRTFRTLKFACERLLDNEMVCLNFTKGITCQKCKLCSGLQSNGAKSIVIPIH